MSRVGSSSQANRARAATLAEAPECTHLIGSHRKKAGACQPGWLGAAKCSQVVLSASPPPPSYGCTPPWGLINRPNRQPYPHTHRRWRHWLGWASLECSPAAASPAPCRQAATLGALHLRLSDSGSSKQARQQALRVW